MPKAVHVIVIVVVAILIAFCIYFAVRNVLLLRKISLVGIDKNTELSRQVGLQIDSVEKELGEKYRTQMASFADLAKELEAEKNRLKRAKNAAQ